MIKLRYYPTRILRYTSPFGPRWGTLHRGVDIGAETPMVAGDMLYATADGMAKRVRADEPSYGNYIIIEHDGWCDLYAHLEKFLIAADQAVHAGQAVGVMGATGDVVPVGGVHLHYEIRDCRYANVYDRGDVTAGGIIFRDMPKYLVDPEPYINAAVAPPEDCSALVAARCGLSAAIVAYINKYLYAADLWRKLWAVIGVRRYRQADIGNPNADLATAIARECGLSGPTIAYIWRYADKATVYRQIWQPLWWNMQ